MSFLSVFSRIVKVGGNVAPAVITAVNPAAGAIISLVVNEVIKAEETGGSGAAKRQQVIQQLAPAVGPIVSSIMQAAGSHIALRPEGVSNAIGQITDGVVTLLNALQAPAAATASSGGEGSAQPAS